MNPFTTNLALWWLMLPSRLNFMNTHLHPTGLFPPRRLVTSHVPFFSRLYIRSLKNCIVLFYYLNWNKIYIFEYSNYPPERGMMVRYFWRLVLQGWGLGFSLAFFLFPCPFDFCLYMCSIIWTDESFYSTQIAYSLPHVYMQLYKHAHKLNPTSAFLCCMSSILFYLKLYLPMGNNLNSFLPFLFKWELYACILLLLKRLFNFLAMNRIHSEEVKMTYSNT